MKLTKEQVMSFQPELASQPIGEVVPLSGGQWSQAFAFKTEGEDLVMRFGEHKDDYLKDQLASRYASAGLRIPRVLEVGEAFGGNYAVSVREFGIMIDNLDHGAMLRVIPSLLSTMDAMRTTDISQTTGFGNWGIDGNGEFGSWREVLLSVNDERPDSKIYGWKIGLQNSPSGDAAFNKAYARLVELSEDLPEVRALVHNDLMNFNVLVNDDKITAVIDWANALYGDFLYDLAQFTFWGVLHKPIMNIDWEKAARAHYKKIGLDVPQFDKRLKCCMIRLGLDAQAYYGFKKDWEWLEPVAARTLTIAEST